MPRRRLGGQGKGPRSPLSPYLGHLVVPTPPHHPPSHRGHLQILDPSDFVALNIVGSIALTPKYARAGGELQTDGAIQRGNISHLEVQGGGTRLTQMGAPLWGGWGFGAWLSDYPTWGWWRDVMCVFIDNPFPSLPFPSLDPHFRPPCTTAPPPPRRTRVCRGGIFRSALIPTSTPCAPPFAINPRTSPPPVPPAPPVGVRGTAVPCSRPRPGWTPKPPRPWSCRAAAGTSSKPTRYILTSAHFVINDDGDAARAPFCRVPYLSRPLSRSFSRPRLSAAVHAPFPTQPPL